MANIQSTNIKVFPSVGRSNGNDPEAELTNEKNLTQLTRNFYSFGDKNGSYVISPSLVASNPFEFVIRGFYFKVKDAQELITIRGENHPLYAGITVYENPDSGTYQVLRLANSNDSDKDVLNKLDNAETKKFEGISFATSIEELGLPVTTLPENAGQQNYTLLLVDETGSVPPLSKLHWELGELNIKVNSSYEESEDGRRKLVLNLSTNNVKQE